MWGLGRLSTALLAAMTTTNQYSPRSVQEMSADFRRLIDDLGEGAPVYQQATTTIRFNFVTPPPEGKGWRDTDVLLSDADLMADDPTELFSNVAFRHGNEKPIALFLPGLDGFGISAANWQYDDLARTFELWRMSVNVEDRTSFRDLLKKVCQFIEEVAATTDRPVYLIGESFGGLLAPAAGLSLQNKYKREGGESPLKGLVMVNPATSFDDSNWDVMSPALSLFGELSKDIQMPFDLPSPYSVLGGIVLSTSIPTQQQNQQLVRTILGLESLGKPNGAIDSVQGMLDSFKITGDLLPPAVLHHRISNWILAGSPLVNARISQLELPTLVVVGTDDQLLGSGKEARRLMDILPNCEKLEVQGAGHLVLDDYVNLTEAIIYSQRLDPLKKNETGKPYDPILDWKLPSKQVIDEIRKQSVNFLEEAFSPIYISTDEEGQRTFGLENLPKEGPLLFVSNHQLLGLDLNMLISESLDNNITVRGLAHPVLFQTPNRQRVDLDGRTPGLRKRNSAGRGPSTSNFELFGAVMVTPKNYYRLMESGQNVLLFPGGAREVFHGRDDAYKLLWPDKVDFVRTAARFNATIIPLSSVGMADSLNILLDPDEVASLPLIGVRATEFAKNVTAARFDMANEDENFLPPIVAPGLPSRNYFLFGKPMRTSIIDHRDKDACALLYESVQEEMRRGFQAILTAREKDPYKDAPSRLVFERLTGKKAPTFALNDLGKVRVQ